MSDDGIPLWVTDTARSVLFRGNSELIAAMLERDEDVTDRELWIKRRTQFREVIIRELSK